MTDTFRPSTVEEFNEHADNLIESWGKERPFLWGIGYARMIQRSDTQRPDFEILDTTYLSVNGQGQNLRSLAYIRAVLGLSFGQDAASLSRILSWGDELPLLLAAFKPFGVLVTPHEHRNIWALSRLYNKLDSRKYAVLVPVITIVQDSQEPVTSVPDAYLRLSALSRRVVQPRSMNLDGLFATLPNNHWTSIGPVADEDLEELMFDYQMDGRDVLDVEGRDKFPKMTRYVPVPSGVRVADASRVRLGAYLGEGTTVMHEGFVNFNAGTLGKSMVEGRISAGVVVGDGTDIGGGASIMGTLSGGGKEVITIGERTLIGANGGIGISLGDDCIVEAGLYVTAGAKVMLVEDLGPFRRGDQPHARELSGSSGLLFRRDSLSGRIEVLQREGVGVTLNEMLHNN